METLDAMVSPVDSLTQDVVRPCGNSPTGLNSMSDEKGYVLQELARLLTEAVENGDKVTAIAERIDRPYQLVSALKNGTYRSSPTVEILEEICGAIGVEVVLKKRKQQSKLKK